MEIRIALNVEGIIEKMGFSAEKSPACWVFDKITLFAADP